MFWKLWSSSQFQIFKSFAYGAGVTGGSTAFSCYLALEIEKTGHQVLFFVKPHWYADVEYASGLTQEQLDSVRHYSHHHHNRNKNVNNNYNMLTDQQSTLADETTRLTDNNNNINEAQEDDNSWRIVNNIDQSKEETLTSTPQSAPLFTTTTIFTADFSSSEPKKASLPSVPSYSTEVLACSMTA